jgi:hypothetical protein
MTNFDHLQIIIIIAFLTVAQIIFYKFGSRGIWQLIVLSQGADAIHA